MVKQLLANAMVRRTNTRVFPIEELERRQDANGASNFNNSIYFAGVDPGGISVVARMAFRNDMPHQNLLKIHLPGEGIIGFENEKFKDGGDFKQGPFIFNCCKPGTNWQIIYNGYLDNDQDKELSVFLTWESEPYFLNFGTEGTQYQQTIDKMMTKTWNKDFFTKIRGLGKVHYEQAGSLCGTITYKEETHHLKLTGIRDHNYGSRDWNTWNKHIWLVGILEDGQMFNISTVDYEFIEDLKAGYIGDCKQRRNTLWKTPNLSEMVQGNSLPRRMEFDIIIRKNGRKIPCTVRTSQCFNYHMDGVYNIHAATARFTIGKLTGTGIAEFGIHKRLSE